MPQRINWRLAGLTGLSFLAAYLMGRRQDQAWERAQGVMANTSAILASYNVNAHFRASCDGATLKEAEAAVATAKQQLAALLGRLAPIHQPTVRGYLRRLNAPLGMQAALARVGQEYNLIAKPAAAVN